MKQQLQNWINLDIKKDLNSLQWANFLQNWICKTCSYNLISITIELKVLMLISTSKFVLLMQASYKII
jgi:hypothetical protein